MKFDTIDTIKYLETREQMEKYIEVWGYETSEYLHWKANKIEAYRANGLSLLQMADGEVKTLDDFLRGNILAKM